jgi:Exonuclease VII, large subunit
VDPLSVSQVLAAYNTGLTSVFKHKALTLIGILEPKNNTAYGGKLYWYLVDGGARLTVQIPERSRDLSGRRVKVTGRPSPRLWKERGEFEVTLYVESITPFGPPPEEWIGPLRPIGEQRQSSWPAIERSIESRIVSGDRPRVLMFFGTTSVVDKDVFEALGQHADAYQIEQPRRIALTDPAAVAAALSLQDVNADLVAIVRGGGEGISALSDRQVIEAVAHQVRIPIVSAVGHEPDRPLIQDVVHHAFATPTALGTWLAARATGAIQIDEQEAMQRQLKDATEEAGALRRRVQHMRALLFVALGILACILIALLAL